MSISEVWVSDDPAGSAGGELLQGGQIDVLERTEEEKAPGDSERFAHYVRKERITESVVEGGPVVALCGKVWTPTRNPDRFPICPTCREIYRNMGGSDTWPFGPNRPAD